MAKKNNSVSRNHVIMGCIFALLLGWFFSAVYYTSRETTLIVDDHSSEMSQDTSSEETVHAHEMFIVDSNTMTAPTVRLVVDRDAKSGWNLTVLTTNFRFTPEDVNSDDVLGEGHAHLWVDGEKVGRLYGNHYHLDGLSAGDHEITVTLNTNSHKDYMVDGQQVQSSVDVVQIEDASSSYSDHSH